MAQEDLNAQPNFMLSDAAALEEESRRRRRKLLSLLRGRYHWAIVAALLLGAAGAVGGYFIQGQLYSSTGRLEMKPVLPSLNGKDQDAPRRWDEWLETKMSLIRSPRVIKEAMASPTWKKAVAQTGVDYDQITFAKKVMIQRYNSTNMLDVSFTDANATLAVAGVNATINAYMDVFRDLEQESDVQLLKILLDQQAKLTSELHNYAALKSSMAGQYGVATIEPQFKAAFQQMVSLQSELDQLERNLNVTGSGSKNLANLSEDELIGMDAQLTQLDQQRQTLQQQIERYRLNGVGPTHRAVQQAQSNLTIVNQQIAQRVRELRTGEAIPMSTQMGDADAQQMRAREQEVKVQLAQAKQQVNDLGAKLKQIQDIDTKVTRDQQDLAQVQNTIDQMRTKSLIGGRLSLIAPGIEPTEPSNFMTRIRYAVVLGVMGIGLGVGLVMMIGLLDPRLRHIEDAEIDLPQAPILGILPTLPENLNDAEQAVSVAHSVHHIRTLLQIDKQSRQVLSITSPVASAGKTSLTMALGLSYAAGGAKTLMIDADIVGGGLTRRMGLAVHPRLGRMLKDQGLITDAQINDALRAAKTTNVPIGQALIDLGYVDGAHVEEALLNQQEESVGLLDACTDEHFDHCVAPTGVENLYVLPIGTALPQQAGALSPSAMRHVISQARDRFDAVLIDAGPLLGSLEACMSAAAADGTILIVSRGNQKPLINKCMNQLSQIGGKLVGIVFNHALATDIARSTYGSVTTSQSRHPSHQAHVEPIDADTSARFGPLATAVASYAPSSPLRSRSQRAAEPVEAVAAAVAVSRNGNLTPHRNGHAS